MKTRNLNYVLAAGLAMAMLGAAGCSNNNSSSTPASTNAVYNALPPTNEVINNAPPAGITNAPVGTNSLTPPN